MSADRASALLVVAGLLETGWAIGLKYTAGFTRLWPSVATAAAMIASIWLLARALRVLPVGTGYAVWTGIGTVGAAILGIVLLGESRSAARLVCLALIVAGILGLRLRRPPNRDGSGRHLSAGFPSPGGYRAPSTAPPSSSPRPSSARPATSPLHSRHLGDRLVRGGGG